MYDFIGPILQPLFKTFMNIPASLLGLYCQVMNPAVKSAAGWFWTMVTTLWPWYWIGIMVFLVGWTIIEIFLGPGTSENGFSPAYNRVVGSGVYLLLQALTYVVFIRVFGDLAYCRPWSLIVHYLVFFSTGGFLHAIHFWPYWRIPFIGKVRFY